MVAVRRFIEEVWQKMSGMDSDGGNWVEGFQDGVYSSPVSDPPPLNWSDLIVRIMKEDRYGEEDIQARGDCFEAASG